ncbi:complement C1q tumor necrosis factor-related protein 3-like, partial [Saccostrea cucullata]|uniref:complement C1q tumor necrosis factor-related protein 3-like n=1 Tax=Saccostrea cuccullata TaxID=36930 RepID=UPI002ED13CFE
CTKTLECLNQKTHVAFYAFYSNNFKALPTGTTLIFDSVETNLNSGYNKITGIFTAPTSGVYAFTWTLHAASLHVAGSSGSNYGEMNASIKLNGVTKGAIVADTETQYDNAAGTGFVILNLKAGDEIKIVSGYTGQGAMYSTNQNGRTSFSGFQIT